MTYGIMNENDEMKVRMGGLEPPRLSPPDPKSGAATNYANAARVRHFRTLTDASGYATASLSPQGLRSPHAEQLTLGSFGDPVLGNRLQS